MFLYTKCYMLRACAAMLMVAFTVSVSAQPPSSPQAAMVTTDDTPVVTVDGTVITHQQVSQMQLLLQQQLQGQQIPREQVLEELVKVMLLAQQAKKESLDETEQYQQAMALQSNSLLSLLLINQASERLQPTDAELQRRYQQWLARIPSEEYAPYSMVVKEAGDARKVIKQLQQARDKSPATVPDVFAELAKKHSIDISSTYSGKLGWVTEETMQPEVADIVVSLAVGEVNPVPVKVRRGWQVVYLKDKRQTIKPTFGKMKQNLVNEVLTEKLLDYVSELKANAEIIYH